MAMSRFEPGIFQTLVRNFSLFARSNTGIVSSSPTQGMDVCLCLFCLSVFILFVCVYSVCVDSVLATG
jgi:hypothetical protein